VVRPGRRNIHGRPLGGLTDLFAVMITEDCLAQAGPGALSSVIMAYAIMVGRNRNGENGTGCQAQPGTTFQPGETNTMPCGLNDGPRTGTRESWPVHGLIWPR
jgi:hypothetical protein